MINLGKKHQEKQFASLGSGAKRLGFIKGEASRCIKCYNCIEQCPICYCNECSTKKPHLVRPGLIPPDFMFHLIRFAHVSDSCVNCGQCQELCPMDIPNALVMHSLQVEMQNLFGYVPGYDMQLPVLAFVEEAAERKRLADTGSDQIFNIFTDNEE